MDFHDCSSAAPDCLANGPSPTVQAHAGRGKVCDPDFDLASQCGHGLANGLFLENVLLLAAGLLRDRTSALPVAIALAV